MIAVRLSELVDGAVPVDPDITGVTADSRRVRPGFLFAALPGAARDGRSFIAEALKAGAAAVLVGEGAVDAPVPVIPAEDPRRAYARAAAAFYGRQPEVAVAVTGTNGKTSVAGFVRQIEARLGRSSASIGTLGVIADGTALSGPGLTTPDAAELARALRDLAERGVTHLALEASSHGLDQRRLDGVRLRAGAFLNLTQDHLDYHGDMAAYRAAKLRLFEVLLPRGAPAIVNADGAGAADFSAAARRSGLQLVEVGRSGSDIRLMEARPDAGGQVLTLGLFGRRVTVRFPLAGDFQVSNALSAAGLCICVGEDPLQVAEALETLSPAPGRLQRVGASPFGGEAFVDFAHTPDGLETVLRTLRAQATARLIVVFGAGGDRDAGKRPLMGAVAARMADIQIVTDDNPRTEDPAAIRAAVRAGAPGAIEIADRSEAIAYACRLLREGDVLVVAGKGHEQGQIVGAETRPFDDVAETERALSEIAR